MTYLSARNRHLNLTAGGGNQLAELVADTVQKRQAVVVGQRAKQVLDGLAARASLLLELLHNLALVGGAQGWRLEDGRQLGVLGQEAAQLGERGAGRLERRRLDGGRVLRK